MVWYCIVLSNLNSNITILSSAFNFAKQWDVTSDDRIGNLIVQALTKNGSEYTLTFVFFIDAQFYDHFAAVVRRPGNLGDPEEGRYQILQHESFRRGCMSTQLGVRNETYKMMMQ